MSRHAGKRAFVSEIDAATESKDAPGPMRTVRSQGGDGIAKLDAFAYNEGSSLKVKLISNGGLPASKDSKLSRPET